MTMSTFRFLIMTLGGALVLGFVGHLRGSHCEEPHAQQSAGSGSPYQADPGWQFLPSGARRQFESWHGMFTNLETSNLAHKACQYVSNLMSGTGDESMKRLMAVFVADTRRIPYVEALVMGADTQVSSPETRVTLLCCLERLYLSDGSSAFSKSAVATIAAYRDSREETDPGAAFVLQRLAGRLGL